MPWFRHRMYRARVLGAIDTAVRLLPPWFTHGCCHGFAPLFWLGAVRDRRATMANLRRILPPGTSKAEIARASRRQYLSFAHSLVDAHRARHMKPDRILARLVAGFEGEEHIRRGLDRGRGVILLTAHIGNWELGGALFGLQGKEARFVAVAEPDPLAQSFRQPGRGGAGVERVIVGRSALAALPILKALRENAVVILPGDRCLESGEPIPLFGAPARLPTGPYQLARLAGAPVIPSVVPRMPDGRYLAVALPPLELADTGDRKGDPRRDAVTYAAVLERLVRRWPEQWYNFYPIWETE